MLQCVLLMSTLMGSTIWAPSEEAVIHRADDVALISVINVAVRRERNGHIAQHVSAEISWVTPTSPLRKKQVIEIRVLGGELDGIVTAVSGSFRVSVGDKALVYLSRHGPFYRPWGLSYGWLPVIEGDDGRAWLKRSLKGLRLVGTDPLGASIETPWQSRPLTAQLRYISKLREGHAR